MSVFLLVALTMVAFAANSILNRLGVAGGTTDPLAFALVRLASGAIALTLLVLRERRGVPLFRKSRVIGSVALTTYMIGFSLAYLTLDAGVGALILFGGVQITIFLTVLFRGDPLPARRWQGAGVAMIGLASLLLPGASAPDIGGALLMALAAVGWGAYTLVGQKETDALGATAGNFVIATLALLLISLPFVGNMQITTAGLGYAVVSGVVTSALGYALWYRVLPRLEASLAGIAQLTVPVIAVIGGIIFLGESLTLGFVVATALVLGGVAWSIRKPSGT